MTSKASWLLSPIHFFCRWGGQFIYLCIYFLIFIYSLLGLGTRTIYSWLFFWGGLFICILFLLFFFFFYFFFYFFLFGVVYFYSVERSSGTVSRADPERPAENADAITLQKGWEYGSMYDTKLRHGDTQMGNTAMFATKACTRSMARAWQTRIWCGGGVGIDSGRR